MTEPPHTPSILYKTTTPTLANLAPSDLLDEVVLHPPTHYQPSCKPSNDVTLNILESITTVGDDGASYELSHCVGHGGMGSVYRARCTATGEAVAIKIGGVVGPPRPNRWHQEGYMLCWLDDAGMHTKPPQWSATYDCATGTNNKLPAWHLVDDCPHCSTTSAQHSTSAWNPHTDIMFSTFRQEVKVYADIARKKCHALTPCNQAPPPVTTPAAPLRKHVAYTSSYSSEHDGDVVDSTTPKRRRVVFSSDDDVYDTNCGLPCLYAAGYVSTHFGVQPWMALQLLNGNSLADVLLQQQPSSRDEFVPYAHRMLGCVQMLHDLGWVHRDIKPSQFCHGLGVDRTKLFLVDLGFAIPVETVTQRPNMPFSGTYCYGSSASLWGATPGRRDDLESLVYSLLELWWGQLPWMCVSQLSHPTPADVKNMVHVRNKAMFQARTEGLVPDWALRMFAYLDNMDVADRPDYAFMHRCIANSVNEVLSAPVMAHNWAEKRGVGMFGGRTADEE